MNIPYWKILIYILTFVTYIYAGFGASVLSNLRDAVLSAQTVFGDVFNNIIHLAKKFKDVHEVFDAAVEEHCVYKCPVEGVLPKPNRNHVPKPDGCGSLGLKIPTNYLPINEMTKCCDLHDVCYDTCNSDKELCDVEFKRCLYKYCDTNKKSIGDNLVKACKGAAKMLFTGTLTLGCKSYLNAQEKACYCPSPYGWKNKKDKYTRGDGEL